jgi:hypothetical protein
MSGAHLADLCMLLKKIVHHAEDFAMIKRESVAPDRFTCPDTHHRPESIYHDSSANTGIVDMKSRLNTNQSEGVFGNMPFNRFRIRNF